LAAFTLAQALTGPVSADTIKIGVIGPLTGGFALFGSNFKKGIDAWVAANGSKAGGHDVEFIFRDEEGPNPARAKALAQELILQDKVQYLAGFYFTPDALAAASILAEAKVPMVVMNAATSAIVEKSPNIVRTSFTMWQNTVPAAKVAKAKGSRKVVIAVSNYGPGTDAEKAFRSTFEAEGGAVVDSILMPLNTTDFSPIMQKIKDTGADTVGFVKAYIDNGLKAAGVKLISTGDVVDEPDLPSIGESGIGILSTYHYAVSHRSPENEAFLKDIVKAGGKVEDVTMTAVAAYDGARLIYKMIEATGGTQDPEKALSAVKGLSWVSPRGPVTIDPETRHIRQNVYLRAVAKRDGALINDEIEIFPDQPDWGLKQPAR
jgi:branched-chain amino acid transport system substrate-binding protein